MAAVVLLLIFMTSFGQIMTYDDTHSEELYVKPLQSGHVYSDFQFTTLWNSTYGETGTFTHYHLFPKSLGDVLEKWGVEELHLTQTQGVWRWDNWNYPLTSAPPGAELWVWFHKDTHNVDQAWKNLINMLSGMFCASLNFLDNANTVSNKWSFRPQGASSHAGNRKFLRYAALPREMVCTENLTPWKKLLPCGARSGLGALLNALKLYDASYHSLGIHFRSVCKTAGENQQCSDTAVELKQTLAVVFEPPITGSGSQDWSFKKMFGRMVGHLCPLAVSSHVYVELSQNKTAEYYLTLTPDNGVLEKYVTPEGTRGKVALYDVSLYTGENRVFNLGAKYNKAIEYKEPIPPLVYAHQYQTGYGQEKGGVLCLIYNHDSMDVPIIYTQILPWYLRTYIHTLKIDHFPLGMDLPIAAVGNTSKPSGINYEPGRDHQRPYLLEMTLTLPASTITRVTFQFERALLKWTEYPPDANHGFYVTSAVITTPLPRDWQVPLMSKPSGAISNMFDQFTPLSVLRIHTEHLLVSLPTPDFSMPYNVICLACTVIAIAFGSLHNLTTRRFVVEDPNKKTGIKGKIKLFLSKFRRSKPDSKPEPSEEQVKDSGDNSHSEET